MNHAELLRLVEASGPELRQALDDAISKGVEPINVRAEMRASQWAEQHFYLSAESSYEEQAWRAYPFQRAMLDAMGSDDVEEVDIKKSARVGYTKMALAAMGYMAEHKRRNQALYQPTDDDRDEFVTTELEPMLRDVPVMRRIFPKFNRKSKDNTLKVKRFLGCLLHLRGGKAAKNYRRLTVDTVWLDELSGFDSDIEKEGAPDKLAWKRTEGAVYRKMVAGSTPKLRGFCLIEGRHDRAELRFQFHVRCIHCQEWHPLTWGGKDSHHGMKWAGDDAESVAHLCPHCGALMTQGEYLQVWEEGRWIAQDGTWITPDFRFICSDGSERAPPRHIGFHVWTAYSPQTTWAGIVREFIAATEKAKRGDKADLKTFVNTTLGETWEEEVEKTEASALSRRARLDPNPYRMGTVPRGALVLVAGVDVQGSWWQINVWAFGRGDEKWMIDRLIVEGNPADQQEWEMKLAPALERTYQHQHGPQLNIRAAAIDTGGHYTHQAYVFVRSHPGRNWYAVKGESTEGKPIKSKRSYVDVNERGKVVKRGVALWFVGTDTAKDLLHGQFDVSAPGPGYVHFPVDAPDDFYKQVTAEARVPVKTARGDSFRWIKPAGARNEDLDCTVYSMFCAQMLDLHKYSDLMWRRLESALEPDLFDAPVPEPVRSPDAGPASPAPAVVAVPVAQPVVPVQTSAQAVPRPAVSVGSSEWSSRL